MFPKDEFKKYATKNLGMSTMHLEKYMNTTVPNIHGFTPQVIEERQLNVVGMDVFSRLMMDRIIFLGVPIDDYVANIIQAQLLFLESNDQNRDIQIYLNTPGGSVYAGLGIYDTMQYIKPDVATICTGMAASMGAVLLCAGQEGKRTALTHSRVLIHQPMGGAQGQASDIAIQAKEILRMKDTINDILALHTGQDLERIKKDTDRDFFMSGDEAKEYGLIDHGISSRDDLDKLEKSEG